MFTFTTSRDRDAWNTFRGYVYQVHLTIERWLDLQPEQTLELERGEDIDIVDIVSHPSTGTSEERQRLLEQVKHRQESITLRKPEAITAIACFLEHQENNLGASLHFRYTSNVKEGQERPSPMPNEISAIAAWKQIWQGSLQGTARNAALQGIRTILENVKQPDKLHDKTWQIFREFIEKPNDNQLLNLICRFEWNTQAPKASSLSLKLQERLIERQHATDDIQAEQQYQKLFVYLFKILCEPGIKKLTVETRREHLSDTLSESDHQLLKDVVILVHALEEGMEVLEQKFAQNNEEILLIKEKVLRLDRERSKPYDGQDVASRVKELLRDYTTKLFVGREDALSELDKFFTQTDKKYLTITAPAGFGKTALLANWIAMRQDKGYFIAYHFFQRDDITRSVSNAYRNLLRQLHDYYESSDKLLPTNEDELRDKLRYLLENYEVRENKPLVMVVDGLDEASPERSLSLFLPQPLPKGLYVIVSVRVNEVEKLDNLNLPTQVTQKLHLNPLLSPTIADWLRRTGNESLVSLAQDETFVAQVCHRTEGRPLFLKYLIDELVEVAQQGEESAIRKTLAATPKGFPDYIRQQYQALDQLEDWRSRPDLRKIFYFLTIAKGELSSDDLVELMGESPVGLPWRVSRWFKIRQLEDCLVFSFAHSTLAEQFAILPEIKANTKKSQKELIKYCADWQEHHSPYALRHYAEHLYEAKQWEKLYAIASNEDFATTQRQELPDEPELSLKTVQTALLGAADTDDAAGMAKLLLVHAQRLVQTTAQETPLDALRTGSLNRAQALADLYEIERCALWYLLLAWELKDTGRLDEAQATLEKLRKKQLVRGFSLSGVGTYGVRASYAEYAAYLLAYVSDISKAAFTELTQRLLDDYQQVPLCKTLSVRGHLKMALETALSMEDGWWKAQALADIAVAQAQDGDKTVAQNTLNFILETAQPTDDRWSSLAAAQAKLGDFDAALNTAQKIDNKGKQVRALGKIATAQAQVAKGNLLTSWLKWYRAIQFAQPVSAEKLDLWFISLSYHLIIRRAAKANLYIALDTARKVDEQQRAYALQVVAIAQAEAGYVDDALETANETALKCTRKNVLASSVRMYAQAGNIEAALKIAEQIRYENPKDLLAHSRALEPIAEAFAQTGNFDAALNVVLKMIYDRARVIGVIAAKAAHIGATEIARELFTFFIKNTTWLKPAQQKQAEALGVIAQVQAELGQKNEARATFTIALEVAYKINEQGAKDWALQTISEKQVRSGEHTAASKTAQMIKDEGRLLTVLPLIAVAHAQVGDKDTAKTIFNHALEVTRKLDNKAAKEATLREIAKGQARIRDFDAALETAQENGLDFTLPQVLGIIGQMQAQDGKTEAARSTFTTAVKEAKKLVKSWEHSWTLQTIAEAQAQTQSEEFLNAALETAREIDAQREKVKAMQEIAKIQIQLRQFPAALGITREIQAEGEQAVEVLAIAAESQVEVEGREAVQETYATALKLVREIRNDGIEARALETLAKSQAKSSFGSQAIRTTDLILINRYQHLPNVAAVLAEIGDKENFNRLLIPCAYYLDATYEICGHLARLYPEKAEEIAKVLSELN